MLRLFFVAILSGDPQGFVHPDAKSKTVKNKEIDGFIGVFDVVFF